MPSFLSDNPSKSQIENDRRMSTIAFKLIDEIEEYIFKTGTKNNRIKTTMQCLKASRSEAVYYLYPNKLLECNTKISEHKKDVLVKLALLVKQVLSSIQSIGIQAYKKTLIKLD